MKRASMLALTFVACCTVGLAAQTSTTEQKEKTKVEIKNGKSVTVTGCLERTVGATGYILTDDSGRLKYAVVTNDDLSKYVGHQVQVKGNAADRDATVKIEQKVEGTSGAKTEAKTKTDGDSADLPYLGLKSVKTIGTTCKQ
jgi:uncharacterized protein YdeI (BOF family)